MATNLNTTYCRPTIIPMESIKKMAESMDITNLTDEAATEIAQDVTYRLKIILQDTMKFMLNGRRTKLVPEDVDHALKLKNIEPTYGFHSKDHIPFGFSPGRRTMFCSEEETINIRERNACLDKPELSEHVLRSHWLAIDGVQPTIPENPPPVEKEKQKLESIDPIFKLTNGSSVDKEVSAKPVAGKIQKLRHSDAVPAKQLATHELSVEQQLYYKEITEACVGTDELRRTEALQSLATDSGLHEMVPRLCTFIAEGVKVNVVQNNLALLIYLMRMAKSLFDNPSLNLEKYLHELLPSVVTCIVSKQLCLRPDMDNHWALRDFSCRIIAQLCRIFNTSTNNLQTRLTRLFANTVSDLSKPFSTLYGAIQALSELGPNLVAIFVLPKIKSIGKYLETVLEDTNSTNIDKIAATQVKQLLVKLLKPILFSTRVTPDVLDEYCSDYGYLGAPLYTAVCELRTPISEQTSSLLIQNDDDEEEEIIQTPSNNDTVTILHSEEPTTDCVELQEDNSDVVEQNVGVQDIIETPCSSPDEVQVITIDDVIKSE